MKKTLFAFLACCLVASSAFAQLSIEPQLSEDNPQHEEPIEIDGHEQGIIFIIKINGEPDSHGRTPVQIELENNSDIYEFLLFDHAWDKKELQKQQIHFEKGFVGKSTLPIENIKLNSYQSNLIQPYSDKTYKFPDILIDEGQVYECKIPIHLAKPAPCLFQPNKKKLQRIIECTIRVSVDKKDKTYEKLKRECDSLFAVVEKALEREDFCTNPNHRPSFDMQTEPYTSASRELRDVVRQPLYNEGWPKESKKYQRYKALLESLDEMDYMFERYKEEKHDCGMHKLPTCGNCKLSLAQIYNRLNSLYMDLHNGDKQKLEAVKEANGLYRCAKTHSTHAKQWKSGDPYATGIEEFYQKIKNY